MSGICGIVHFDGAPAASDRLEAMLAAAPHRGHDRIGRWVHGPVALGHLLTEVGLPEEHSAQPLIDKETGCVLVAHARLDNREDLQHVLEQAGIIRAPAASNPELILAAYRHWGPDCADRIAGDFAFVLWDPRQRRVFAARDPMAMRPLYYRIDGQRLVFASEVKQILALPNAPAEIREEAVANFLAGRFGDLKGTFFEDIYQLEPSHAMVSSADGVRTWQYWDLDPHKRIRYKTEEEYVEHFRELLIEAARVRFRSSQPAGLLLSGGLDSGAVASVAGVLKQIGELECPDLQTYSWAFPTLPQCDERKVSDVIAHHFDFPTTYIDAEKYAPLKTYPEHAPDADGPFLGVYDNLLEKAAECARSEGVGYLFSGHRGDLLVGDWLFDYFGLLRRGRLIRLIRELRDHRARSPLGLQQFVQRYLLSPLRASLWPPERLPRVRRLAQRLRGGLLQQDYDRSPLPPWMPQRLRRYVDEPDQPEPPPSGLYSRARRQRHQIMFVPLHMHVALRTERMYARHQLVPSDIWTDRRLMTFALAVPQDVLCRAGENKHLLRQSLEGIMPENALSKAAKVNPEPLYLRALREDCAAMADDLISKSRSKELGLVDGEALRRHYKRFQEGDAIHPQFWAALSLEMWLRNFPS